MRLELLLLSTLLVLSTGFVSAKDTAATSQSNALTGTGLDALIDKATSRVLQKYKGKVPADVKTKVLGKIDKLTGSKRNATAATNAAATSNESLLQAVDQVLPDKLMDKLPAGIRTKLGTASTNKFEKLSYWPGLNDPAHQISIYTPC